MAVDLHFAACTNRRARFRALVTAVSGLLAASQIFAQEPRVLVAALRQRLSSIHSADIRYTVHTTPKESSGLELQLEFRWAWLGPAQVAESFTPRPNKWVFDGQKFAHFHAASDPPHVFSGVTLRAHVPHEQQQRVIYGWVTGHICPYASGSLADLLSNAANLGPRSVDGRDCPTLNSTAKQPNGATLKTTATLDPARGWFPVRIEYALDGVPGLQKPEWAPRTTIVSRFATDEAIAATELPDGADIDTVFDHMRLHVTQMRVNHHPAREEFAVVVPDGLQVNEFTADDAHPQHYLSGGPKVAEERMEAIRSEVNAEWKRLENEGAVVDARPKLNSSYRYWLVAVGVALALTSILIWRSSARR